MRQTLQLRGASLPTVTVATGMKPFPVPAVELRLDLLGRLEGYRLPDWITLWRQQSAYMLCTCRDPRRAAYRLGLGVRLGCDAIDIDSHAPEQQRRTLVGLARFAGVESIASIHLSAPCGSRGALLGLAHKLWRMGATGIKIAVPCSSVAQLGALLDLRKSYRGKRVLLIPLGCRFSGYRYRNSLVFGYLGRELGAGQPPYGEVVKRWKGQCSPRRFFG